MKYRGTLEISKMSGPQLRVVNFFTKYHDCLQNNQGHKHWFECGCSLANALKALKNIEKIMKDNM